MKESKDWNFGSTFFPSLLLTAFVSLLDEELAPPGAEELLALPLLVAGAAAPAAGRRRRPWLRRFWRQWWLYATQGHQYVFASRAAVGRILGQGMPPEQQTMNAQGRGG